MKTVQQITKPANLIELPGVMELSKGVRKPIVKVGHTFRRKVDYRRRDKFKKDFVD